MLRLLPLRLAAVAALTLALASPTAGQVPAPSPDRWQLTLTDHSYLWDVRLVRLTGDTLTVTARDSAIGAPVQNITEIRLLPETILRVGDGHRSAIGALGDNNAPVFDLAPLPIAARRKTIQALLDYQATVR